MGKHRPRSLIPSFRHLAAVGLMGFAANLSVLAPPTKAAQRETPLPEVIAVKSHIEDWLAGYNVPSAAIAYIQNGEVVWTGTFGEQSPGTPVTQHTLYNIASLTKPLVAETALRLASKGAIDLKDPMARWWLDPDIADDPRALQLTVEMALSHRTGFANWRENEEDNTLRFRSDPGEKPGYSGEGYDYVGHYLEKRLGAYLETIVADQLFTPLNMLSTSFIQRRWFLDRVAIPQGPEGRRAYPDIRLAWSAADDVYTTIGDYAEFLTSVMAGDEVSPKLQEKRLRVDQPQMEGRCPWGVDGGPEGCPQKVGFGLGWAVFAYDTETVVLQGGGDWGERAIALFVPEKNSGVVVLTNGANGSHIIKEVVSILYPNEDFIKFLAFQAAQ